MKVNEYGKSEFSKSAHPLKALVGDLGRGAERVRAVVAERRSTAERVRADLRLVLGSRPARVKRGEMGKKKGQKEA